MNEVDSKNDPKAQEKVGLKREMGLFSAVNFILAIMIGSGIFVSPASVLKYSGSVGMCLTIWILCGLVSLLGALAFAELGIMVPRSGGQYAFFMDSFGPLHQFWGPLPAFLYSWTMIILIRPAEVAVIVMTFSEYLCQPIFDLICLNDGETGDKVKKIISLVALGVITYVNVRSVKLYVKVQNIFGSFKILACLVVIIGGAYELFLGNHTKLTKGFQGTSFSPKNLALAFYSGLWAYDGWATLTTITEEVQRPEKNILRSIIISVPVVTGLYVFMNIAYMTVLSVPEIMASKAVAVSFGEKVLGPFSFIIPFGVALSTFGCALSIQFGVTRLCYVSGQDGFMLESFSYINYKKFTPSPAVIFQGLGSFVFILSGDLVQLIEFSSFLMWVSYGASMVSLLVLRRVKQNIFKPYRVPVWVPVFILLVSIYLALAPIINYPDLMYLFAVFFTAAGIPVYYWFVYKKRIPRGFIGSLTYVLQVVCEAVPPQK
ncbi:b(0,+)-type amino acid transporter 1-like isoform X1 [Euwallacea similis]|uniref:b(0,+)-type amino acid transporter 1-like isoform X1 n=1 Tax=Euwallacea similis TaxID=1736056 RepID=UPI003450C5BE